MVRVGDPAPEVVFTGADGAPVALSSFRGKPLLLLFLRHLG